MRIWILKDSEPLPLKPGVKMLRASMLANALAAGGHEVHYWCSTFSHFHKERESAEGQSLIKLPNGLCHLHRLEAGTYDRNLSWSRFKHHRMLACKWTQDAPNHALPDIIIVAYPIIEWAAAAVSFGKRHNIPVIIDVRDQWPDTFVNYVPSFAKPLMHIATNLFYRHLPSLFCEATAITSMSSNVLEWALQKANRPKDSNTAVFYLGTSLANNLKQKSASHQRPSHPLRCLFLGTFGNTSDIMTIAKAARILQEDSDSVHITIAGDGDYREELQQAITDLDNVSMVGWCDSAKTSDLLIQSDVALLTGHNEAMPNKFFDYVAAGLPMLCSLRGEVRDYIQRYNIGICFDAENPEAIVSAIRAISGEYNSYSSRVLNIPEQDYSEHAIYMKFSHFITTVANNHINQDTSDSD